MSAFTIPELRPEPVVVRERNIEQGRGRTLLLIVAHADDPAMFIGGAVSMWARAGWRVHCLRVTDDRWDSVGIDEIETIRRNAREFREAATVLGISSVEDLGWRTDVLGDASRVALRERMIHAIRRIKPYGLVSFDPYALFHEDNLDHKVLAEAVDEAFWTAQFDKHHVEHFVEGLAPHGVFERWYFGRSIASVTHVFDTESVFETQVKAILSHPTMLANIARQFTLQSQTAGIESELVSRADSGDFEPLFRRLAVASANQRGAPFKCDSAEYLRLARFPFDRLL